MGNANKKKSKENKKAKSQVNDKPQEKSENKVVIEKYIPTKLHLELVKKFEAQDTIEEVISHPYLTNSIIIACRKGDIKVLSDISSIINLYSFLKRLYSLILLQKTKQLCVGLDNEIAILDLKKDENKLILNTTIKCNDEGGINSLLQLENENIISTGKNIILWKKNSSNEYKNVKSIPAGLTRIINLVEFPYWNTIIATQEETHKIFVLKNNNDSIELIKEQTKIPSIWYKGSAQKLSKNAMLLVGKFELNVIDPFDGSVISRYPGIDRGTLLNFTEQYDEKDIWIVTNYMGRNFEFYEQEGNDLIYFEKYEFDESDKIGWGNRLVKINKECFATTNHYGVIHVFKIKFNNK